MSSDKPYARARPLNNTTTVLDSEVNRKRIVRALRFASRWSQRIDMRKDDDDREETSLADLMTDEELEAITRGEEKH